MCLTCLWICFSYKVCARSGYGHAALGGDTIQSVWHWVFDNLRVLRSRKKKRERKIIIREKIQFYFSTWDGGILFGSILISLVNLLGRFWPLTPIFSRLLVSWADFWFRPHRLVLESEWNVSAATAQNWARVDGDAGRVTGGDFFLLFLVFLVFLVGQRLVIVAQKQSLQQRDASLQQRPSKRFGFENYSFTNKLLHAPYAQFSKLTKDLVEDPETDSGLTAKVAKLRTNNSYLF